ncbi:alpha/beta hydrolase [Pedobacter sp. MC2016-05]|uniref:alpha/beta fold hydrolase n=1 Tax=Pedobacter sp. MC2016-05 TaxID=2994474 RepID=UPI002245DD77|nr:alpha/beta hydrolase [Pedobacter sp. MC2016-05]MCX2474048.1 alpha/beta hydrolase [Pedobacter sp. MC2016-05]
MKILKQIVADIKTSVVEPGENRDALIRKFVLYSPKMPLRLHQEQLIAEAKKFNLSVYDEYFKSSDIAINCFSWGDGKTKILLTHGWASKALDFYELIMVLRKLEDVEIIAFDAPGNGSSVSELSNLILYKDSVKAIIEKYEVVDFVIGHSLGAMANILALQDLAIQPKLLMSIAPLIKLKENFVQSLESIGVNQADQDIFFSNFELEVKVPANHFNLLNLYHLDASIKHLVIYDPEDHISPYPYLQDFLTQNKEITAIKFEDMGHFKIIKSPEVISLIVGEITTRIN